MKRPVVFGCAVLLAAVPAMLAQRAAPGPSPAVAHVQPISWEAWAAAKSKAEESDAAGNYVVALQYYLEYTRQAEGLDSPARVAWGKNNAAYMIIKMHQQDPTVDLAPAEKLLKEGLAVDGAGEDCRKVLAMNLEYIRTLTGPAR
jgi:hypothetical protein